MKRLRRLVLQLALLPALWAFALAAPDLWLVVVGWALLGAWPVAVAVAVILNGLVWVADREERDLPETAMEAAANATSLALMQTGLALVALVEIFELVGPTGRSGLVLLTWAVLVASMPGFSWLGTLHRVWLPRFARRRLPH